VLRRTKKRLVYLLILLIPLFLFFSRSSLFSSLKFQIVSIFSSSLPWLSIPLKELNKIIFYHHTYNEYERLMKETAALKSRLMGMEEVIRENTRFETLLSFKRSLVYSSVAAKVIARDPSYWNASLILDKGIKDGVRVGMPVLSLLGVVGRVVEVGKYKSKVIGLTDPQFSVPALIQSTRDSVLVSGSLEGLCRIRYLTEETKVKLGDQVITSSLSTSFPEGLPIGIIVRIHESPADNSLRCDLRPAVLLSQVEEVLIILR
jgi:rod shape-determining protein MreC